MNQQDDNSTPVGSLNARAVWQGLCAAAPALAQTAFVLLGFWTFTVALFGSGWGQGARTALLLGLAILGLWTSTRAHIPGGVPLAAALLACLVALLLSLHGRRAGQQPVARAGRAVGPPSAQGVRDPSRPADSFFQLTGEQPTRALKARLKAASDS
jgi:hypothetical protein